MFKLYVIWIQYLELLFNCVNNIDNKGKPVKKASIATLFFIQKCGQRNEQGSSCKYFCDIKHNNACNQICFCTYMPLNNTMRFQAFEYKYHKSIMPK